MKDRNSKSGHRRIDCGFVFGWQQYLFVLVHLVLLAVIGIVHYAPVKPYKRRFKTWDPDINYPTRPDPIPLALALVLPLIALLLTLIVAVIVSGWSRRQHNPTYSTFLVIFLFVDGACAWILQVFCQQISNVVVGELRPNFIAHCKPNPAGKCTGDILWAEKSFYSGHAATGAVLCTYASLCLLWLLYYRHRHPVLSYEGTRICSLRRVMVDFGHILVLLWILAMLTFAWFLGITRIIDNQHHVADVAMGFFVGAFIAALYFWRATLLLRYLPVYGSPLEQTTAAPAVMDQPGVANGAYPANGAFSHGKPQLPQRELTDIELGQQDTGRTLAGRA